MFPDSEYPWTRTLIVIINGSTHVPIPTLIPAIRTTTITEITTMEIMIIVIDTDG